MMLRAILSSLLLVSQAPVVDEPVVPFRFVVLGHVRGSGGALNPKLGELVEQVKTLSPDLVVLTGDIIWGDINVVNRERGSIVRQWEAVDSAIGVLGVPILRVPGNHDINDVVTRDVYFERYGRPPSVVTVGGHRFILLTSAWIPRDGDTLKHAYVRGQDLDSAQVAFLSAALARPEGSGRTFVFLHHLLWWEDASGPWWREVHPLLVRGGVDAVFSGDYGPLKFSHAQRDGVEYYQASMETAVSVDMLRALVSSWILSSQFDCYLEVVVGPAGVDVKVHTVAEVSSGAFTPERFAAIAAPARPEPLFRRVRRLVGTPKRLVALGLLMALLFGAGFFAGRKWSGQPGRS